MCWIMNHKNKTLTKNAILLILAISSIALFKTYVMNKMIVSGDSMADTFNNGDVVWVEKMTKDDIKRFDVIVIKATKNSVQGLVIKRVIGLPNETVFISDGKVYIDGELLASDDKEPMVHGGLASVPFHLKDGEYFVLGDNRNASSDSRELWLGAVKQEQIIGKPLYRIFPLNRIGKGE